MNSKEWSLAMTMLRPRLLRFAVLQLRDMSVAEDVVQETLLSATERIHQFAGSASISTWVFAILKNKIIDEFRRRDRQPQTADALAQEEGFAEAVEEQFDERGHWVAHPMPWSDPQASLEQRRFWAVFEICISGLPEKPARVFGMRELLGMETEEICKELGLSASNCWVLLHRARLGLRDCLSRRWFGEN